MRREPLFVSGLVILCFLLSFGCQKDPSGDITPPSSYSDILDLPAVPYDYSGAFSAFPAHIRNFLNARPEVDNTLSANPITNEGATLGRVLFYDKALSVNNKIACASCHHQDKAFTDGASSSEGFNGEHTRRNSMSTVNLRYFRDKKMFWDLRAADLETQVLIPIQDHIEMGFSSIGQLETKLRGLSYYPSLFKSAFGNTEINGGKISRALSQFLRSIVSFNSKYDQGLANNFASFTTEELNGKQLVIRANCVECHSDFTTIVAKTNPTFIIADNSGLNTGAGSNNALDIVYSDNGIGELSKQSKDMGTFKIPTLRNVALTAPYMHDGRFTTLEQVIEHYNTGAKNHPNRGIQIPDGGYKFLATADKAAIIAFLKTLTDQSLITDKKFSNPFK
jgi:cytochrome c peroxidase